MQAGGALTTGIGSYFSAKAQKATYAGQASIADTNAQLAEDSAQSALMAGAKQEQAKMLETTDVVGKQVTGFAANGIDVSGGGSVDNVISSTKTMGEIDADTINANAVRQAWGYRIQATGYKNQALQDRATSSGINPAMQGATSLMSSGGQVAESWYKMNKSGVFSSTDNSLTRW